MELNKEIRKILREFTQTKPKFPFKWIDVIAAWMNYGAGSKPTLAKMMKLPIPPKYKTCSKTIYRLVGLKDTTTVKAHVGSWTTDLKVAKEFIRSNWFSELNDPSERPYAAILCIPKPDQKRVMLNIDSLFADPEFTSAVKAYESAGKYFNEGLEFGTSQHEVVYNAPVLTKKDICLVWSIDKQKWVKP